MNNCVTQISRKISCGREGFFAAVAVLIAVASAAQEPEIIDVPESAIAAIDVNTAMDRVSAKMGYYWLRSLRGTCTFETPGGERGVNNYGIRLYNLAGLTLNEDETGAVLGTVHFNYAPVEGALCRIPYKAASRREAVELAAAFRKLSREPSDRLGAQIEARYAIDVTTATSLERFLTTEVSVEIAKLLLQEHMRSLHRPGGAGDFVGEARPLAVGSDYTAAAIYVSESGEPDTKIDSEYRLLAVNAGDYEVEKKRAGRVTVCRDRDYFRAITHEGARECRSETGAVTTTSFVVMQGQASFLPANLNTASFYEADAKEEIVLASGRSATTASRYARACYAEALETVSLPAGSFETVRFLCASVRSRPGAHEKTFGPVWVDRNTGLPVRSEMQVHAMYRSQRYALNESIVALSP
ncbi:MAG: hypothetical protein OEM60_09865 [Gammaproteobacteria bacterium]|nr:hypothetical protein [Gammaproteobacteria bacterium]